MIQYIMITNFDGHWDTLTNNETGFTMPMIRFGNKLQTQVSDLIENATTLFIKREKDGLVKKTWKGTVSGFEKRKYHSNKGIVDRIYFKVNLESSIECPIEFIDFKEGWYLNNILVENKSIPSPDNLWPSFFTEFSSPSWSDFEDNTFRLLRLVGIHTIHPYDKKKQKGKPDGVFKIDNTVVIYDCTLDSDFLNGKKTQIENYIAQLQKDKIDIGNVETNLKGCDKYVWIITRGIHSRIIKRVDDVRVLEIPISNLIELYNLRLTNSAIDEKELEKLIQRF